MRTNQNTLVTALAAALLAPTVAIAQSGEITRTGWGKPDLNGVWDFRSLTPLERPEEYGDREFLTEEEARSIEQGAVDQNVAADTAPAQRTEAGGSIGAYNRFWMDYGTQVVGNRRTSDRRSPQWPAAASDRTGHDPLRRRRLIRRRSA